MSSPRARMAVRTLFVGMASGFARVVNMSKAERISDSCEGVRPVEIGLSGFRRFEGG